MNKKTFIKELKEKLSILDEDEVKDIISEYTDTIEQKMKDGKTESEAIADFGDVDTLAKEILKAYKINSKYADKKEPIKEVADGFENVIRKGANSLSNFTKEVVKDIKESDSNFTLETIFEIILKAIALLLICAVLRIPFMIITGLGEGILNIAFFPMDHILGFVWNVIIWIVYVVVCILIGITMFKNNIKTYPKKDESAPKKKEKIKAAVRETKNNEPIKEEVRKDNDYETRKSNNQNNEYHPILNAVLMVLKIFVTIFITIPIIIISVGISIALCILIYYLFTGIYLIGPIFILIGLLVFFNFLCSVFINIFNGRMRHFVAPIIVSIVFVMVGSFITFEQLRHYTYSDTLDHEIFEIVTEEKTYQLNDQYTKIRLGTSSITKTIDNNLPDGEVKLILEYSPEITKIDSSNHNNYYYLYSDYHMNSREFWMIYDNIIENLRDKKVYSYREIFDFKVTVLANEETLNKVF